MSEIAKAIYELPIDEIKVELIGEQDFKDEKIPSQTMKKRRDVSMIFKLLRDRLQLGPNDALVHSC